MASAGLRVPYIYAVDLTRVSMLLEDLGDQTYLEALTEDNADELFAQALDALILWQRASRSGELPDYDAAALRRELQLFTDWYLGRHLSVAINPDERRAFDALVEELIYRVSSQGRVWIHRDWMPRNLMPLPDGPGVLDFQDAATGPVTYDVASCSGTPSSVGPMTGWRSGFTTTGASPACARCRWPRATTAFWWTWTGWACSAT